MRSQAMTTGKTRGHEPGFVPDCFLLLLHTYIESFPLGAASTRYVMLVDQSASQCTATQSKTKDETKAILICSIKVQTGRTTGRG